MSNLKTICFIIQARTGSTRLPDKMLLPFYNQKIILDLIIEKLLERFMPQQIILATTTNSKDDLLEQVAIKHRIPFFRGDENNVLKRFVDCADANHVKHLIRVCADNPFLDLDLLCELIESIDYDKVDYASYCINETPSIKTHFGFFAEYVSLEALKKVQSNTNDVLYLEHVTNFIYANPSMFKIYWKHVPSLITENIGVRLTVDTIEDFEACKLIYKSLIYNQQLNYLNIINYINLHASLKRTNDFSN
ncbi:MAG: glycosyl transferase family 2 [Bacteroidetes bacterium]|nr:glycosyl transferase family 2 [Bacteroidota bacterium]